MSAEFERRERGEIGTYHALGARAILFSRAKFERMILIQLVHKSEKDWSSPVFLNSRFCDPTENRVLQTQSPVWIFYTLRRAIKYLKQASILLLEPSTQKILPLTRGSIF